MNKNLKYILETAMQYEKSIEKRDLALDEIYTKLVVRPLQRIWIRYYNKKYNTCICCYNHDE